MERTCAKMFRAATGIDLRWSELKCETTGVRTHSARDVRSQLTGGHGKSVHAVGHALCSSTHIYSILNSILYTQYRDIYVRTEALPPILPILSVPDRGTVVSTHDYYSLYRLHRLNGLRPHRSLAYCTAQRVANERQLPNVGLGQS